MNNIQQVENYLVRYGLVINRWKENLWQITIDVHEKPLQVMIEATHTFVRLEIAPIVTLPQRWLDSASCLQHILKINQRTRLCRISLDDYGELVLGMDILQHQCTYESFSQALEILAYYAETLCLEIIELINIYDPKHDVSH